MGPRFKESRKHASELGLRRAAGHSPHVGDELNNVSWRLPIPFWYGVKDGSPPPRSTSPLRLNAAHFYPRRQFLIFRAPLTCLPWSSLHPLPPPLWPHVRPPSSLTAFLPLHLDEQGAAEWGRPPPKLWAAHRRDGGERRYIRPTLATPYMTP